MTRSYRCQADCALFLYSCPFFVCVWLICILSFSPFFLTLVMDLSLFMLFASPYSRRLEALGWLGEKVTLSVGLLLNFRKVSERFLLASMVSGSG